MGRALSLFLFIFLTFNLALASDFNYESLPIQDAGRTKPLLTVATESLQLLHGKSTYEGKKALDIMTTWMLVPEPWSEKELIKIDHHGLKEALGFDKTKKYFSVKELTSHPRLNIFFSDLAGRVQRKEKLNAYYQAVQRMESQLITFHALRQGALRVFPPASGSEDTTWVSVRDLEPELKELFFKIMSAYTSTFVASSESEKEEAQLSLQKYVDEFTTKARTTGGEYYPKPSEMNMEVHYQKFHPFMWTWILYLIAAILFSISFLVANSLLQKLGFSLMALAFIFHTYGFILRCLIVKRPPVSNMYETVVWVGWGVVLFAGIFTILKKNKWLPLVGAIVATLCMIVADFAPVILDGSLQPLEPVLRSNLWLTIHVMTITLSYAAFFLAFGVGDYGIFLFLKDKKNNKAKIRELAMDCYRLIQVGVVLLAAGTILGGVWADYSWGRFWGWDPKETWAFIALMGYLAILHARLVGWVKDFGMLAGSIVSFSLVIMAWYGVNFVLGAGLHSYGFGAGGIEYVSGFVILHIIYVCYAWLVNARTA